MDRSEDDVDEVLGLVNKLRHWELGRHVNLPQLVICGDRLTDRKRVLEALSDAVFPDQKICDQFRIMVHTAPSSVTDLSCRDDRKKATVTIIPSSKRSDQERDSLLLFRENTGSGDGDGGELNFCGIFKCVTRVLGLGNAGEDFVEDVVRVEIRGSRLPYLSINHLPGLLCPGDLASPSYAAADFANAAQRCAKTDPITLVPVFSRTKELGHQRIMEVALENEGVRMFSVLLEPRDGYKQVLGPHKTLNDLPFFGERMKPEFGWYILQESQKGDHPLAKQHVNDCFRKHASEIFKRRTQEYMPSMRSAVRSAMLSSEKLGKSLESHDNAAAEYRRHVLAAGSSFSHMLRTAVDALSPEPVRRVPGAPDWRAKRLGVEIREIRDEFNGRMRREGQKRPLVGKVPLWTVVNSHSVQGSETTRSDYLKEIRERLDHVKGRELPGSFNAQVLYDLFLEQSSPWEAIARDMAERVIYAVRRSTREISARVLAQAPRDAGVDLRHFTEPAIDDMRTALHGNISIFLKHHQRPITFTKDLVEAVDEVRLARQKEILASAVDGYFSTPKTLGVPKEGHDSGRKNLTLNTTELVDHIFQSTRRSEERVCPESLQILQYLEVYYEMTLKRFLDDVGLIAVDMCVLNAFPSLLPRKITAADVKSSPHYEAWRARRISECEAKMSTLRASSEALSSFDSAADKGKQRALPPLSDVSWSSESSSTEGIKTPSTSGSERDETPKPVYTNVKPDFMDVEDPRVYWSRRAPRPDGPTCEEETTRRKTVRDILAAEQKILRDMEAQISKYEAEKKK